MKACMCVSVNGFKCLVLRSKIVRSRFDVHSHTSGIGITMNFGSCASFSSLISLCEQRLLMHCYMLFLTAYQNVLLFEGRK